MGQMDFPMGGKNGGYSKFLDWDEFRKEFRKDFCPAHSDVAAIKKLESTTYYQKSRSIDDYLDEFIELVAEAGYVMNALFSFFLTHRTSCYLHHCLVFLFRLMAFFLHFLLPYGLFLYLALTRFRESHL